jgi:hypothetical protein
LPVVKDAPQDVSAQTLVFITNLDFLFAGLGKEATLYLLALSPGYGVFGAAVLFALASAGDSGSGDVSLFTVVLSLVVTLGLAVVCFVSSRSVRESLGGSVALGGPKRAP